ncbi:cache domain-containing protein [Vibrio sp. S4M6]|uniref:bifunctional diguanylate cyclase/phosphodiesterase n=1 Tax=Vibrio sinus TaxID=2946865 RepID=UPI00202A0C0F|nr:cache domain-containing protein [Vibrio sinus]MCL9781776.1 cache domain-containing protein [Vibrio sinus]
MNQKINSSTERWILRSIQVLPVALMLVFILVIAVVLVTEENRRTQDLVNGLRDDFVANQQAIIKNQINNVYQQIEYEKSLTIKLLKRDIESRVEEAYQVVEGIYNANPGLEKQQIIRLIHQALFNVRFNEGRGYYFIFQMDGVNVMHPLLPHIEGTSKIGVQDLRGTFIVKEHIDLIKASKDGSAFYRWWFKKPGEGDKEFEKIGYAKHFKPYDWFIGTGEYVADVEAEIKRRMLLWLTKLRYGNDNYVFVVDLEGKTLAHKDETRIGNTEMPLFNLFMASLNKSLAGLEGYVRYDSPYVPESINSPDKISYIRLIESWGWIIGTGVFTSDIETLIAPQLTELEKQHKHQLYRILVILFTLSGILLLFSLAVSRFLRRRFVLYQMNISDNIRALEDSQEQLRKLATIDSLTSIPNRTMLEENLKKGLEHSRQSGDFFALMFVDLDDFKRINDTYGHHVGDELLKAVGKRFEILCGEQDVLARFGGDEFVFGYQVSSKQEAKDKADAIRRVFDESFSLSRATIIVSCSIGVSISPDDGSSFSSLLSKSDIALYRSKEQSKGQILFYDHKLDDEVHYHFQVEESLRNALKNEEISVHYQPKLSAETGDILGVEALCRWNSEKLGMVRPDVFIQIAEKTGLIIAIGEFVLQKACDDINALNRQMGGAVKLAINISPIQLLDGNFYNMATDIVKSRNIEPSNITFELTENVLLEDLDKVLPILTQLNAMGFGISLDDFGTGYSSLRYLNSLPITEIKIDREFVMKMEVDNRNATVVKTIVLIGLSMGLNVVAEGVETHEQQKHLKTLGCHELQGYLFDPALPLAELIDKYSNTP